MSDPIKLFFDERKQAARDMYADASLQELSLEWMKKAYEYKYPYNFTWLGRPIIKFPQDIVAIQEIVWNVKPDLIIETGIAHGGSLILSASLLQLLGGERTVVGVDIDIRKHNREALENHPLHNTITLLEGSSTDPGIIEQLSQIAANHSSVMVMLDSYHTHDHVLHELQLYSQFVSIDSYLVAPDTFIEFFPAGFFSDRPWDVGNNPYTALQEFLKHNDQFVVDQELENKLLITEGIGGYLKRVR